jgi:hypothetical protein
MFTKSIILIFALFSSLMLLSGLAMVITGYWTEPSAAEYCGTQRAMFRGDGPIFMALGVIGLLVSRALSRWVDFDNKDNLRHG